MTENCERWLSQTKTGGGHVPPEERGDCVPACIASILGKPLSAIANTHGEGWWDRLQVEVGKHGYCLSLLDLRFDPPPTYWIAAVPSLNLPTDPDGKEAWHSIVCRGYELVHDPGLGKRYDAAALARVWEEDKVAEGWLLSPLDPADALLALDHEGDGPQPVRPSPMVGRQKADDEQGGDAHATGSTLQAGSDVKGAGDGDGQSVPGLPEQEKERLDFEALAAVANRNLSAAIEAEQRAERAETELVWLRAAAALMVEAINDPPSVCEKHCRAARNLRAALDGALAREVPRDGNDLDYENGGQA